MKFCLLVLPLLAAGLSSCDKAKQAAEAVRHKIGGVADPNAPVVPGGEVAPDLASQVDSAAEGVRFRRDLPFPTAVKVRVLQRHTFKNARVMSTSALGKQTAAVQGTWEDIGVIERDARKLTLALEKSGKVVEAEDAAKDAGNKAIQAPPQAAEDPVAAAPAAAGKTLVFELGQNGWRAPETKGPVDFSSKLLSDQVQPGLPVLLAAEGVLPRTQWFLSTRRWIGGDKLILEGDSVQLLFPGEAPAGKVTLVYEAAEALDGHPCGRFSVTGDVALKGRVDFSGEATDAEMTINSGKIWCSLLHPLILREEYDVVATLLEGSSGGPRTRIQGGIEILYSRQWKP